MFLNRVEELFEVDLNFESEAKDHGYKDASGVLEVGFVIVPNQKE